MAQTTDHPRSAPTTEAGSSQDGLVRAAIPRASARIPVGGHIRVVQISTPYQRGTPLRSWSEEPPDVDAVVAELAIKASASLGAIRALIRKGSLTVDEEFPLGPLNSHCFLQGYEPMVMLVDVPRIDPAVPPLLQQYSKHFRTP